jgi:acyl carrier protein
MKQTSIAGGGLGGCSARFMHDGGAGSGGAALSPIREAIIAQFKQVAAAQEKPLRPLTDDLVLLESGLDSLCFAIIVAELEDDLGLDPFSSAEEVYFPVTFGDFVRFYENAAA